MTRLQLQLRDAAEREAQRGPLGRAARDALRSPALAGAVAALALVLAVGAGALLLRDDTTPAGPAVVAQVEFTGNPEQLIAAFGSVWIADPVAGEIVRVDSERRAVTARIAVGSALGLAMEPVGGELWAIGADETRLLRIDPATDRVTDRVPLRTPDGRSFPAFQVLASDRAVWAVSGEGALRLDPQTGAGLQLVAAPSGGHEPRWITLGEDVLWVYGTDGTIRRFDPVTGAARGRIRPQLPGTEGFDDLDGDLMAFDAGGRYGRMDGSTGAVRWQRAVGDRIHSGNHGSGLVWLHVTRAGDGDRLVALDPRDGAVVSSTSMPGFGSTALAVVGDEVWLNEPGGDTIIVRRGAQPTR